MADKAKTANVTEQQAPAAAAASEEERPRQAKVSPPDVNAPVEEPEFVPSAYRGRMVVRPHGMNGGEREITVQEWENTYSKTPGKWDIVRSNVIASHHSDGQA